MDKYTTMYGREVQIEPISVLLLQKIQQAVTKRFESEGKILEPPTYCTELPGGDRQCFPHDKDTIRDDATPQEEKDAWDAYQKNTSELNEEITERFLGAIIMDQPVEYEEGWEHKLEWLGIDMPEDELDRKVFYMTHMVLKHPDDIQGYILKVMEISAGTAGRDAVEAARAMFRGGEEG